MKFTPIAVLALFTLTANAQQFGDVFKVPGEPAAWSESIEDEDVTIMLACMRNDGKSFGISVTIENEDELPFLSYVRITNDPNKGWNERVWIWGDDWDFVFSIHFLQ